MECDLVSTAKKLVVDKDNLLTVGSKISPVYFKDGIPVECSTTDNDGWVIGGNTDGAHKLITSEKIIGDPILDEEGNQVLDENGEPKYEIEYKIKFLLLIIITVFAPNLKMFFSQIYNKYFVQNKQILFNCILRTSITMRTKKQQDG